MNNGGHRFIASDKLMDKTTPKLEPKYKNVKREENRQNNNNFREAEREEIFHPLEALIEEVGIGYKLFGDKVSVLLPYAKTTRQKLIYNKSQKEEHGRNLKLAK